MFTGIITDIGRLRQAEKRGDTRFTIETRYDMGSVDIGASICCSGTCLTVVSKGNDCFAVDVSAETLACTTLGSWQVGQPINLERALRLGDELGGHIVTGHVDGVGTVKSKSPDGDSQRFVFEVPAELARHIASKGSVAVNGVSLTVNEVEGNSFGVNIIPHTQQNTDLGKLGAGDKVNLEVDILARYVARLTASSKA